MTAQVELTLVPERHLVEVVDEHPLLAAKLRPREEQEALLASAAFSGRRGPQAMRTVLGRHRSVPAVTVDGLVYLTCCECRDPGQPIVGEFACPTERDAFWGLRGMMSAPAEH